MWLAAMMVACRSDDPGTGPATTPDAAEDENLASAAGDWALDFLRASPYDRIHVEIDQVQGAGPDPDALDHLRDVIEELCDKPGGVEIEVDDTIPSQGSPAWTVAAAQELEIEHRDTFRDAETGVAAIYYLYVDGHSADDDDTARVLGFAYHGSSLVMFGETIADTEAGLPLLGGGDVERTVLAHELGHLLGLVDNGVPMQAPHRDAANGDHCTDESCLMYWAVETDLVGGLLGNGVPDLDDACRADLAAARGG